MTDTFLRASPRIIQGIGANFEARLHEAGITTIAHLLTYKAAAIQGIVVNASLRLVQEWLTAAQFLQLEGVTPQIAEVLIEDGIDSVNKLAEAELATVETVLMAAYDERHLIQLPSLYEMAAIQQGAWRARDTGTVYGWLLDAEGNPLADVLLKVGLVQFTTTDTGYFELVGLPEGNQSITVPLDTFTFVIPVLVKAARVTGPVTIQLSEEPDEAFETPVFHEHNGGLIVLGEGSKLRVVTVDLSELPDNTYIQVRYFRKDGQVRMLHMYRAQVGRETLAERVYVHEDDLPRDIDVGDVLHYVDGGFERTDLTPRDVAWMKLTSVIGERDLILMKRLIPNLPGM